MDDASVAGRNRSSKPLNGASRIRLHSGNWMRALSLLLAGAAKALVRGRRRATTTRQRTVRRRVLPDIETPFPAGHPEKPPWLPVPASQPLLQMIWEGSYNVQGPAQAVVCPLSEQGRSNPAQCLGWSEVVHNREALRGGGAASLRGGS